MSKQLSAIEFIFVNKPSGVATHRPSDEHVGFVEWFEKQNQEKYWICNRLDKETSGVLVFAKNKHSAHKISELFFNHQVQKEYLFLSHKKSKHEAWKVVDEDVMDARGDKRPSQEKGGESITEFERLNSHNSLYLYKAKPRTGKTHQIRKHAVKSGIPILGDYEYGGNEFPRLMLHSHKIKFQIDNQNEEFQVSPSMLFDHLHLCEDLQLSKWICSIDRRGTLFPQDIHTSSALRLLHSETGDLRIDQVGSQWVMGWWNSQAPTDKETHKIKELCRLFKQDHWIFQWRPGVEEKNQLEIILKSDESSKHGFSPESMNTSNNSEDWDFLENKIRYRASLARGQNFGLFLDQRERRTWVKENAKGMKVLNLFAFSCGFSVNAAIGGAEKVVSVDLFKKYLDWGRENFLLNDLNPESDPYEFRMMDSMEYLSFAKRKALKFDIIICDPPSFSRHKKIKKVFRVERDFKNLIDFCYEVLTKNGVLLFSTNYEKWDLQKWKRELNVYNHEKKWKIEISNSQWDFEWQKQDANLKAFYLRKLV